ncbi:hypothetical protein HY68_36940 [Streptomyces sp. AcH 505]|uniref:DUF6093 family protein n=1 Tax=Streptomyces sp. AcH 505 TaxID=352211 RepID=UPI000591F2F0|nr:hypothetical protein HY68_36940 [Streptomyces sp. AcH 505]
MAGLDGVLAGVKTWLEDTILIDTVRITLPSTAEPVLNTETGLLEQPDGEMLYEGPGAVIPRSGTGDINVVSDATQPWTQDTKSSGLLLTPLEAPIAPQYALISVRAVHDPARTALLGRTWICADPGLASTVEVVRRTPIDQKPIPVVAP